MWIKPLRPMTGVYGRIRGKVPVNLPDNIAEAMIQQAKAVPCQSPENARKAMKEVAKKAAAGPTKKRPSGGQDGTEKPSSSSPADPAPETKTSVISKTVAES